MDLLRIPGLLMYMIRLCLARSAAERRNVKRVKTHTLSYMNLLLLSFSVILIILNGYSHLITVLHSEHSLNEFGIYILSVYKNILKNTKTFSAALCIKNV